LSSSNEIPKDQLPKSGFSRRSLLQSAGVSGGVLTTGLLAEDAEAQSAAAVVAGEVEITLDINGKKRAVKVEPRVTLLDALRNRLDLTGAKRVCDRGTCGACTMIVSGKVVYGCSMLAIDAVGKPIQTIEGLAPEGQLHPVSKAFVNHDAQQCGYCTPGFIMATKGFLDRNAAPTPAQIDSALSGNLCRCGTYMGMKAAVLEAAKELKNG
jgi:xanthine dehydrogenase YagT iron-sulfur-binding subunit